MDTKLLDSLHTIVMLLDTELNLHYINLSGEVLLQISSRTIIGRKINTLIQCPHDKLDENCSKALATQAPITRNDTMLEIFDGRQVTVDCVICPLIEVNEKPQLLIEITPKDQQLRVSREQRIRHENKMVQDIIRRLAHEIKNPLGGLRGAAQLLEEELPSADLVEYTQVIISEADRLQKLVDQMLGPNQLPDIAPLNIHQVLAHIIQLINAEYQDIHFIKDYDPSIPDIIGDKNQLIQAILNIVQNALKAMNGKGDIILKSRIKSQFLIAETVHRLVLKLEIIDHGAGIPKKIQDSLFFPMISGRQGGMGLGLSIAQSLIARHHGLIECSSRAGQTIFTIFLPIKE